jgi:hypothetical protein
MKQKMETEDDTFRKLKQIPYNNMRRMLIDNPMPAQERTRLLAENGWTLLEYQEANYKYWAKVHGGNNPRSETTK